MPNSTENPIRPWAGTEQLKSPSGAAHTVENQGQTEAAQARAIGDREQRDSRARHEHIQRLNAAHRETGEPVQDDEAVARQIAEREATAPKTRRKA